jgi:subfamily B ATP-binding cassette protein HlyB/CyaB
VLGAAVLEHLFQLPPRYFEQRPTGVIAARLHGVESIREFVAGAAVTLILDLPFLCLFIGIMFYYSVTLTLVALALIACIVALSLVVAPVFRARLNEQFLLGARNQAFVTEYVAGLETVKSLQMEPQLNARYGDYLAEYLRSGFRTRQIGNSYQVAANTLEQLMSLLILVIGAHIVMSGIEFTIGMLVAFQMFTARVAQPMLRLVGLWQQFQQASLSVLRLGDIMNAPREPYALLPSRTREGKGRIEIDDPAVSLPGLPSERRARPGRRRHGAVGIGQEHAGQIAARLPRPQRRRHPARRQRHPLPRGQRTAPELRRRAAGNHPLLRHAA